MNFNTSPETPLKNSLLSEAELFKMLSPSLSDSGSHGEVHMDSDDEFNDDHRYPPVLKPESNKHSEKNNDNHTNVSVTSQSGQTNTSKQSPSSTLASASIPASTSTLASASTPASTSTGVGASKDAASRRIRSYNTAAKGPFTVFIRETENILSPIKISLYINKMYPSTISTSRSPGTIKVTLACVGEANALVADPALNKFHVSIPAGLVEIEGASDWHDLWDIEDMKTLVSEGVGIFNNTALPSCKIVHAERLSRLENDPDLGKKLVETNTVKITFNGHLLPNYIRIGSLRVRVRPFHKKPMFCDKCQNFGHTDRFCRRKPKCAKCSGEHFTTQCRSQNLRCRFCHNQREHVNNICPSYLEVTQSLNIRENNRRKALYQTAISDVVRDEYHLNRNDEDHFPALNNQYDMLPVDDQPEEQSTEHQPPKNPYAKVVKEGIQSSNQNRRPTKRSRAVFNSRPEQPHRSEQTTTQPLAQPRRARSSNSTRASDNPTSALTAAILNFARNAGLSQIWISVLETVLEPLLQAIMPQLPALLGSLGPAVFNLRR